MSTAVHKVRRLSIQEIQLVDKWMVENREVWHEQAATLVAKEVSSDLGFSISESSVRALGAANGYSFRKMPKQVAYVIDDKLRLLLKKLVDGMWNAETREHAEFMELLDS